MDSATEQLDLYCARWTLSEPEFLTKTQTSTVFRAVTRDGEIAILKLLNSVGIEDEKNGAAALLYFNGHGAVKVLESDSQAILLEYADGENLSSLVRQGEDDKATEIIAATLAQLHQNRADIPASLWTLEERFGSLFRQIEKDRLKGHNALLIEAAIVTRALLDSPQDICVLHGDIHHDNILFSSERGWLAIDPKGLVGERTYDLANALCNPVGMPEIVLNEDRLIGMAQRLSELCKINTDRILRFTYAYSALSACWFLEDGLDASEALAINAMLASHIR